MVKKKTTSAVVPSPLVLPGFVLSRTGLSAEGQPTFEEWQQAGQALAQVDAAVHWWIGDWLNHGELAYGDKYTEAEKSTGFKYGTLRNDKYVSERVELSLRNDKLSWNHHFLVAPLPPKQQQKWLALAVKNEWPVSQLRQAVREWRLAQMAAANPLPAGQYRVLYADPPWKYGDELIDGYGAAEHHYPTMTVAEMAALKIVDLALDNAVLFLWATLPMLPEALTLAEAWGFAYKTLFVWDKVKHNYGHYSSVRSELLLLCTRGSCLPDTAELVDNVIVAERSEEHSAKPEAFRSLIDQLYVTGPKLELFARQRVDGWQAWGNEVARGE